MSLNYYKKVQVIEITENSNINKNILISNIKKNILIEIINKIKSKNNLQDLHYIDTNINISVELPISIKEKIKDIELELDNLVSICKVDRNFVEQYKKYSDEIINNYIKDEAVFKLEPKTHKIVIESIILQLDCILNNLVELKNQEIQSRVENIKNSEIFWQQKFKVK